MALRSIVLALGLILAPVLASAATVAGQVELSGTYNPATSSFTAAGGVDMVSPGTVQSVTEDFDTYVDPLDAVSFQDVDFTAPGVIWSVGGFTFTATSFTAIAQGFVQGFSAIGIVSGNGFEDTTGILSFSTLGNVANISFGIVSAPIPTPATGGLLLTGLVAAAALRRRNRAA